MDPRYGALTPDKVMTLLGSMQPTSGFGELFQYSNTMASAAGYLGGHLVHPEMELGAAFDAAMQQLVFDPLGMKSTTFDFARAQSGDFATAHAPDIDNHPVIARGEVNLSIVPERPAGGAWSTVNDMLKYVAMELAGGTLPDGSRLISEKNLLQRRAPQVAVSERVTYGMDSWWTPSTACPSCTTVGDLIGFHSDMMWLPGQQVGAVVLTNGNPGWLIRTVFRRKLLECSSTGARGRCRHGHPGQGLLRRSCRHAQAARRAGRPEGRGGSGTPLHQRGAGRCHRQDAGRDHGLRLRRMGQRSRVQGQSRRHGVALHHCLGP